MQKSFLFWLFISFIILMSSSGLADDSESRFPTFKRHKLDINPPTPVFDSDNIQDYAKTNSKDLSLCCDQPGDANNDGSLNIGDAVFLGNHVFKESDCAINPPIGCAPECFSEGDANSDGSVNVGDQVFVNNYIFRPEISEYPDCTIQFAVIGDRTGDAQTGIYSDVLTEIINNGIKFAVTIGDNIQGYTAIEPVINSQWNEYFSLIEPYTADLDIHLTVGNHDISPESETAMTAVYETRVGPRYYSFDIGCAHFIVLDNSLWYYSSQFVDPQGTNVDQYNWLVSDLESAANSDACWTFVFMHVPSWYASWNDMPNDPLHTLFLGNGVDAVFTGHLHAYIGEEYDGIKYMSIVSSGGLAGLAPCGLQYGYTYVTFDKDSFNISSIHETDEFDYDITSLEYYAYMIYMHYSCITFENSVELDSECTAPETDVIMDIESFLPPEAGTDYTLQWYFDPGSWIVDVVSDVIEVQSGQTEQRLYNFSCGGNPYPQPICSLFYPLHIDCPTPTSWPLPVSRTIGCPHVSTLSVTFDGRVELLEWGDNPPVIFNEKTGDRVEPESSEGIMTFFAWDNDYLYYAARCYEPDMYSVQINGAGRDDPAIRFEDWVGFSLWTGAPLEELWDLMFDAKGEFYDSRYFTSASGSFYEDISYDIAGLELAYYFELPDGGGENYWSVEVKIPWSGINLSAPSPGNQYGINFGKCRPVWNGDMGDHRYFEWQLEGFTIPWYMYRIYMGAIILE